MLRLGELREITDWKKGRISPAVLFDESVYRREQEQVLAMTKMAEEKP